MSDRPSVTSASLVAALVENHVLDEARLVSVLGEARHDASLNRLELALLRENVVSGPRLLLLKGIVAGLPILDDASIKVLPTLAASVSKGAGALVLDLPETTVAMVEDTELNVAKVANALGVASFEIWLITAVQFSELHKAAYSDHELDTRPACEDIFEILDEAVRRRASDIHLGVGQSPVLRVDGDLKYLPRQPLSEDWMRTQMRALAGDERMATVAERFDNDFAYSYGDSRFRMNLGADRFGLTLAGRKLPTRIPTPDDLGLPTAIRRFCDLERGLVLVTGPTGSGKSTTLAALLNHINTVEARHIITLEDPIEFYLPSAKSTVHQRELGASFTSFAGGLRQALRQDPDVVLVGELRDLETMRTAITAAETGHLVFGTLHTFDAASTVARLVSGFPAEEQDQVRSQLAYILKGVVSQTLLPLQNGRGRAAAYEVMVSTPAIANNLRKIDGHNQLHQAIETGQNVGMQTMEMALADLVKRSVVREIDAEFKAHDVESFRHRLHGAS